MPRTANRTALIDLQNNKNIKNTPLSFRGGRTGAGRKGVALLASHAAGQTEGRGDGGEDGDDHVDNHLPGFRLVFYGHNELGVRD